MERFNPIEAVFKGRHFDGQIIILCVAWYTSFNLSLRRNGFVAAEAVVVAIRQTFPGGSRSDSASAFTLA